MEIWSRIGELNKRIEELNEVVQQIMDKNEPVESTLALFEERFIANRERKRLVAEYIDKLKAGSIGVYEGAAPVIDSVFTPGELAIIKSEESPKKSEPVAETPSFLSSKKRRITPRTQEVKQAPAVSLRPERACTKRRKIDQTPFEQFLSDVGLSKDDVAYDRGDCFYVAVIRGLFTQKIDSGFPSQDMPDDDWYSNYAFSSVKNDVQTLRLLVATKIENSLDLPFKESGWYEYDYGSELFEQDVDYNLDTMIYGEVDEYLNDVRGEGWATSLEAWAVSKILEINIKILSPGYIASEVFDRSVIEMQGAPTDPTRTIYIGHEGIHYMPLKGDPVDEIKRVKEVHIK